MLIVLKFLSLKDSVDRIVQGNTSNIVFLKSTDSQMLQDLEKMSGTTHKVYTSSKSIQYDTGALLQNVSGTDSKVSYTMSVQEEPVIKYNDMAFISERNSIVFRAGDAPIWNRNETILPMFWRLSQESIPHPSHKYTFQTIPTLSSAKDFDIRKNQPDFRAMVEKRMKQALESAKAKEMFTSVHGYDEYEMEKLDPDVLADELMEVINVLLSGIELAKNKDLEEYSQEEIDEMMGYEEEDSYFGKVEDNLEQIEANKKIMANFDDFNAPRYAGRQLSRGNLCSIAGQAIHSLDNVLIEAFNEVRAYIENDSQNFTVKNGSIYSFDGIPFIIKESEAKDLAKLNDAASSPNTKVYAEEDVSELVHNSYVVTDHFLKWLVSLDSWNFADGRFDKEVSQILKRNS